MGSHGAASVVVGVDGTQGSVGALRYAAHQAGVRGSTLTVVHVGLRHDPTYAVMPYSPEDVAAAGLAVLTRARARVSSVAPAIEVITSLRQGSRIGELADAASAASLLVLGRETQHGFDRLVFGTTTAAVVARAAAPTVIVPQDWEPTSSKGPVVAGLSVAAYSDVLLATAFALATAQDVGVEVVHAWQAPEAYIDRLEWRDDASDLAAKAAELVDREVRAGRTGYEHVPVAIRVVDDAPGRALIAAASAASAVVLLRQDAHRHVGKHLGSTTRAVISGVSCVVYVVPAPPRPSTTSDREHCRPTALVP
ncbi:MAG: universal stress protein [Ornithinimicrobium sp.]